jgi:hypothetical protein
LAQKAPAAAPLGEPAGHVILTVDGQIGATNGAGAARFDLAMLDAMPKRATTAETPWFDGARTFEGPLLSEVLEAVGAEGTELRVRAINGYEAVIPLDDVAAWPIILATRIDGKPLSIRDKGPIFVIYPFDLEPDLYNEVYYARSVWQVEALDVR